MTAVVACRGKRAAPQKGQGRVKENLTGGAGTGNGEVERSIYRLLSMFLCAFFVRETHILSKFQVPQVKAHCHPGIYYKESV